MNFDFFNSKWSPLLFLCLLILAQPSLLRGQTVTVTGKVIRAGEKTSKIRQQGKAVVWLDPLEAGRLAINSDAAHAAPRAQLIQKDKNFEPHLLVIPAGTLVDFPNRDPFFHNVFSLFDGKRFDLGLYEAGSTRAVRFDRPGVSYIFCNIHPQMSAVVIAMDTSYYTTASASGELVIKNVPPGRYRLEVWAEGASADQLQKLSRVVTISENMSSLGVLTLPGNRVAAAHKNKYGRDYEPPPASTAYDPHN